MWRVTSGCGVWIVNSCATNVVCGFRVAKCVSSFVCGVRVAKCVTSFVYGVRVAKCVMSCVCVCVVFGSRNV